MASCAISHVGVAKQPCTTACWLVSVVSVQTSNHIPMGSLSSKYTIIYHCMGQQSGKIVHQ